MYNDSLTQAIMKSHETMQKGQEARISYEGDEVTLDIDIKGVTFGKWHLLPVQKPSVSCAYILYHCRAP